MSGALLVLAVCGLVGFLCFQWGMREQRFRDQRIIQKAMEDGFLSPEDAETAKRLIGWQW